MLDDHIDLTVNQLIGLFERRLFEGKSAWSRLRPMLVMVLDELCVSAPQHCGAVKLRTFIRHWDITEMN